MGKPKLKRFRRSEEVAHRNNEFTPLDEAVLMIVSAHHFVRGTFIQALLSDFPARTVRGSTRKLFDQGFLGKMSPQNFCFSHIYHITDAGITKLRKDSPKSTNLIRHKGATLPTNYYHSLMICDVTQNITMGAKRAGNTVLYFSEMLPYLKDPVKRPMRLPYTASFDFKRGSLSVFTGYANPDNAMLLVYPGENQTRLLLIEAERESPDFRTNLQSGSLLRKILGYEDICRKKPDKTRTIHQLGKLDCHVLFVYPTFEEAVRARDKAVEVLKEILPSSKRYLFGVQATQDNPETDPKPDTSVYDKPLMRIGMPDIALKDLHQE